MKLLNTDHSHLRSRLFLGLLCFVIYYLLLNHIHLLYKIYYRWAAAGDLSDALGNMLSFSLQGISWLLLVVWLPKAWFRVALVIVGISALTNLCYQQILQGYIDGKIMAWMLSETRQLLPALDQFAPAFAMATGKTLVLLACLWLSRHLLRPLVVRQEWQPPAPYLTLPLFAITLALLPGILLQQIKSPVGNEINIYPLALNALTISHPQRQSITVSPTQPAMANKILWLMDESISYQGAQQVLPQQLANYSAIDFGNAHAISNCSSTSNAALRWGVNVHTIHSQTDLRLTPTIWAYARQAGYHTQLLDGQVSSAPQNLIWEPELTLIDQFVPASQGIDTDRQLAQQLNQQLKQPGKTFIMAVLRGAHYAYESNYPQGFVADDADIWQRYLGAIRYSKRDFFATLLNDIDPDSVAVFYTSDHGQNLTEGAVPHCTLQAVADEYSVPLWAVLSPQMISALQIHTEQTFTQRSHSQIFPSTLLLMGYQRHYAETHYDQLLNQPTARLTRLGHGIVPDEQGNIDLLEARPID